MAFNSFIGLFITPDYESTQPTSFDALYVNCNPDESYIFKVNGLSYFTNNVKIDGDLYIQGAVNNVDEVYLNVEDRRIRLNVGGDNTTAIDGGIIIEGTSASDLASLKWNGTDWVFDQGLQVAKDSRFNKSVRFDEYICMGGDTINSVSFWNKGTSTADANGEYLLAYDGNPTFDTGTYTGLYAANMYLTTMTKTGTGTIDVAAQLWISQAPTIGTANYTIYVPAGTNYFGGDVRAESNIYLGQYLYHSGDGDTSLQFYEDQVLLVGGNTTLLDCYGITQKTVTVNPDGADVDFSANWTGGSGIFVQGNNGFVGVNTNEPDNPLHIRNTTVQFKIAYDNTYYWRMFVNDSGNLYLYDKDGTTNFAFYENGNVRIYNNAAYYLDSNSNIRQGNSDSLFIIASDNDTGTGNIEIQAEGTGVFIGTTTTEPLARLHVVDGTSNQLKLGYNNTTNCTNFFQDSSGYMNITPYGSKVIIHDDLETIGDLTVGGDINIPNYTLSQQRQNWIVNSRFDMDISIGWSAGSITSSVITALDVSSNPKSVTVTSITDNWSTSNKELVLNHSSATYSDVASGGDISGRYIKFDGNITSALENYVFLVKSNTDTATTIYVGYGYSGGAVKAMPADPVNGDTFTVVDLPESGSNCIEIPAANTIQSDYYELPNGVSYLAECEWCAPIMLDATANARLYFQIEIADANNNLIYRWTTNDGNEYDCGYQSGSDPAETVLGTQGWIRLQYLLPDMSDTDNWNAAETDATITPTIKVRVVLKNQYNDKVSYVTGVKLQAGENQMAYSPAVLNEDSLYWHNLEVGSTSKYWILTAEDAYPEVLQLKASSSEDRVYMGFYPESSTRAGYIGYISQGNDYLYINQERVGGYLRLYNGGANCVDFSTTTQFFHDYVYIPKYLMHSGDADTYFQFEENRVIILAGGQSIFNYGYTANDLWIQAAEDIRIAPTQNVRLEPTGDVIFNPTGNDAYPSEQDINLGTSQNKWLTLHARELWVSTLVAQDVMATIGGRIIVAPTTYLTAALTAITGIDTIHTKHNDYQDGDILIMESSGKFEALEVNSDPIAETGGYYATVTRDFDESGATAWEDGSALVNTGGSGTDEGFIDLYSEAGLNSGTGPTIVGNVRNSTSTWSDYYPHWALGNLNGLYGQATSIHGLAVGKYTGTGDTYALFLPDTIKMYANETQRVNIASDGSGWLVASDLIYWETNGTLHVDRITANEGTIGAFNIDNSGLYSGTSISSEGIVLNPAEKQFYIGSNASTVWGWATTGSDEGILMGYLADGYKLSIGKAGRFFTYDGTDFILNLGTGASSTTGLQFTSSSTKNVTTGCAIYDAASPKLFIGDTTTYMTWNTATGKLILNGNSTSIDLSTDGIRMYANSLQRVQISSDGSGWIGHNTDADQRLSWNATGVLSVNRITANNGTIGGLTIGANSVTFDEFTLANNYTGNYPYLQFGNAIVVDPQDDSDAWTGEGIFLGQYDTSDYSFFVGNSSGNNIYYTSNDGLNITGKVNATGGTFSGDVIIGSDLTLKGTTGQILVGTSIVIDGDDANSNPSIKIGDYLYLTDNTIIVGDINNQSILIEGGSVGTSGLISLSGTGGAAPGKIFGGTIGTSNVNQRVIIQGSDNTLRFYDSSNNNIITIGNSIYSSLSGLDVTNGIVYSHSTGSSALSIFGSVANGSGTGVAIEGTATGTTGGYGVKGTAYSTGSTNYGIYGSASNGTNNWAGYFDSGNVYITNDLLCASDIINDSILKVAITDDSDTGAPIITITVNDYGDTTTSNTRETVKLWFNHTTYGGPSVLSGALGNYAITLNTGTSLSGTIDNSANAWNVMTDSNHEVKMEVDENQGHVSSSTKTCYLMVEIQNKVYQHTFEIDNGVA
jgi:hypothetical protein